MNKILKKRRGREKPTKMSGLNVQGMVKNKLKIVEVKKYSLYLHRFIMHCALVSQSDITKIESTTGNNREPV